MTILGIETSCDETSAAIVNADEKSAKVTLISNIVASSLSLHAKTGGIIPEIAAREQVKYILPVIQNATSKLKDPQKEIDAIAVTVGPGLIGSLLVGVETARTFSYVWNKPIIPVNHLFGHIYANWIESEDKRQIKFPAVALVVSGGHTDLVLIKSHKEFTWLGGTRDDAAGEAFDKTGRILGLPYPAGPQIESIAKTVKEDVYHFPRPLINSGDFDFSFSGLKTAVSREIDKSKNPSGKDIANICFSLQNAVFDILIKKTLTASKKYKAESILLGGGVASNQTLRNQLELEIKSSNLSVPLFVPARNLCTDNAAMIASAGYFNKKLHRWEEISANPELYFD